MVPPVSRQLAVPQSAERAATDINLERPISLDAVCGVGVADAAGLDVKRTATVHRHRAVGFVGDGTLKDHLAARPARRNLAVIGQRVLDVEYAASSRLQRTAVLVADRVAGIEGQRVAADVGIDRSAAVVDSASACRLPR